VTREGLGRDWDHLRLPDVAPPVRGHYQTDGRPKECLVEAHARRAARDMEERTGRQFDCYPCLHPHCALLEVWHVGKAPRLGPPRPKALNRNRLRRRRLGRWDDALAVELGPRAGTHLFRENSTRTAGRRAAQVRNRFLAA
jgi:hypothetical protein